MKNVLIRLVLGGSLFLALFSCKKKDEPQPQEEPFNQNITLNFNLLVGDKKADFASVYTTDAGQRFTFSALRYYVSNIRLVKNDGSEHAISGKYLLVSTDSLKHDLGQVPGGQYRGIKFAIGIDSATNHKDPTVYPLKHPLAIQSPNMHWSWNSGYIFFSIEGTCDTTLNNSDTLTYGQFSKGMFYHVGMDPLYKQVDIGNSSFTLSKDNPFMLNIKVDINKLLVGIDIRKENRSHTMGSMPLATRVANNIPSMFSVTP